MKEIKETPYLIFKEEILEKNYKDFEELCKKYLENYVIAYSVKTNSFGALINKLNELGSNFEIASMEEILITPGKSKVFNGPSKTEEELKMAINGKFLINADSKSEIDKIIKILKGENFNIGLRISLEKEKFGFDYKNLDEIINYCSIKKIKIIGFSFHSGTQTNINYYKKFLEKIDKIVLHFKDKINLKYLDLGGGFPDKIQLKNLNVSLEDYFKLISEFKKFKLKIILEPGRCLVSDSFDLITKVNVVKNKNSENYAIIDVGINLLSKISMSQYKFEKIEGKSEGEKKHYILAGPLLFGNDVLGKFIGILKEGDIIKITNVGAYCYNLAWEISYKKPRVFIE